MNRYPLWKYLVIAGAILLAFLYAIPTLYGTDPGLMVTPKRGKPQPQAVETVKEALGEANAAYRGLKLRERGVSIRLGAGAVRERVREALQERLPDYGIGPMRLSAVPGWLDAVGGKTMNLGLDLRGGVHLLMEVEVAKAIQRSYERHVDELRNAFREAEVRYRAVELAEPQEGADFLRLKFDSAGEADKGADVIGSQFDELAVSPSAQGEAFRQARLTQQEQERLKDWAVEQSITTMRTRVNQLGVSEPVIQRQGEQRIVVQLPGIQDTARAKEVIGSTAQLEFKLVDTEHNVQKAVEEGAPPGSVIRRDREGRPYLLERRTVLSGQYITEARAGFSQQNNEPLVHISFDNKGTRLFARLTEENVGDRMAILLDDEVVTAPRINEEIPGGRAQITGMANAEEAHDVALMLRAGALPAPVKVAEERTVGPTLGQDSIEQGFKSIVLGFALVVLFMAVYYRLFGLVADVALLLNLVFIVAIMSLLQATLTLPGIAGIVLTVGMAVDANTLIFERIREEVRVGNTPHASIHSGYTKALSTIADANITTLIAALVLFQFGSGPVKGFAVTLSVGIVTSMFTAIMVTRAVINLSIGRRRLNRLSIGEG
ncbi:protein translocase subunit SecD [Thiohalorhabdus sp.]|uniref:protein translocase subunit SecD n=1 Tax=Thiohalorhabdus sp. TaxID=3094134 RepID=UPI002FC28D63